MTLQIIVEHMMNIFFIQKNGSLTILDNYLGKMVYHSTALEAYGV